MPRTDLACGQDSDPELQDLINLTQTVNKAVGEHVSGHLAFKNEIRSSAEGIRPGAGTFRQTRNDSVEVQTKMQQQQQQHMIPDD